jgi:hypothetical protein
MSVHAKVTSGIEIVQSAVLDEGVSTFKAAADLTPVDMPAGTSSGQVSKAFTDTRTIAAATNDDLDLAGVLTDALNNTLTFAVVKAIEIIASEDNSGNIIVGAAPTASCFQGWFGDVSDTETIAPGGRLLKHNPAGWTVTPGTGDKLRINNPHTSATAVYEIRAVG